MQRPSSSRHLKRQTTNESIHSSCISVGFIVRIPREHLCLISVSYFLCVPVLVRVGGGEPCVQPAAVRSGGRSVWLLQGLGGVDYSGQDVQKDHRGKEGMGTLFPRTPALRGKLPLMCTICTLVEGFVSVLFPPPVVFGSMSQYRNVRV